MAVTNDPIRIVFLLKNFMQGCGGTPESTRLMAQVLRRQGVTCDAVDEDHLHKDIGQLAILPQPDVQALPSESIEFDNYDWIIYVGPWQSPLKFLRVLSQNNILSRFIYLPKGGLSKIEFTRFRDIKKIPYFYLIELVWVSLARNLVFSSELEKRSSIFPVSLFDRKSRVVPNFFVPSWSAAEHAPPANNKVTQFSFLAEISPRKGLLEIVRAFHEWVLGRNLVDVVHLKIGGEVRPGSERYFNEIQEFVSRSPAQRAFRFLGPVKHNERPQFYYTSHVFLATSFFESYGMTVLEALYSGCVVLAAPQIGVLQYLEQNQDLVTLEDLEARTLEAGLDTVLERARSVGEKTDNQKSNDREWGIGETINSSALRVWLDLLHEKASQ